MAEIKRVCDASLEDAEKVAELSPKLSKGEGEVGVVGAVDIKFVNTIDGDEALKAFAGLDGESIILTPEAEIKLLRKIDLNIMPVSPSEL